jgi:hypothetical protein
MAHQDGASRWRIKMAHQDGASRWRIKMAHQDCCIHQENSKDYIVLKRQIILAAGIVALTVGSVW